MCVYIYNHVHTSHTQTNKCVHTHIFHTHMLLSLDVLISVVRTARMGYLSELPRMTVALSRARLGLYVVGHKKLVRSCAPLKPFFANFWDRPTHLCLRPDERYGDMTETAHTHMTETAEGGVVVRAPTDMWSLMSRFVQ